MNFCKYFAMDEELVLEYVKQNTNFFCDDELQCTEIGNGNLNYIFRVKSLKKLNKSLIVKQFTPFARISNKFKLSQDRSRIEYEVLSLYNKIVPNSAPKIYKYDPIMRSIIMEDLSSYKIMRNELLECKEVENFAENIATFMSKALLLTSDICMKHRDKKNNVKNFINIDLCKMTEDLVYTEPFSDIHNRNDILSLNREWIIKNVYQDEGLKFQVAKLKLNFMNNAQALIHGDLHTGSIFVKDDLIKVIDPEFAFYGPMGHDIGTIIANLIFPLIKAYILKDNKHKYWLEKTIEEVIDLFREKFIEVWDNEATESTAKFQGVKEFYLDSVIRDSAGVAGVELIRRIVGIAHVEDIMSIGDKKIRAMAERVCINIGKKLIVEMDKVKVGKDFLELSLKELELLN